MRTEDCALLHASAAYDAIVCDLPYGMGAQIDEGAEGAAEGVVKGVTKGAAEGVVKGVTKGVAEGVVKGVTKGAAEGMVKGVTKGVAEGMVKGAAGRADTAAAAAAATCVTRQPAGGAAVLRARQRSTDVYVAALLLLANTALRPGGRLTCFVPVFGATHAEAALPSLLEPLMPPSAAPGAPAASGGGLRVVGARQQTFSPTFARWLVCLERDL